MSKIYAFVIMIPFIAMLLFKGVSFYEYDTKQRYIKDLVDTIAYKVKITGVLTTDEYLEFSTKMNNLAKFQDSPEGKSIVLMKAKYVEGNLFGASDYLLGEVLTKGDAFIIYVKSSDVSNYSRIENGGVNENDTKNLYYKAKAVCRVEKND